MAEGFTSSFNPETGERKETRFEYVPVPEMQQQLVSPTQMSETYKYFLSRTQNPKAAIEAANLVLDAAKQFKGRMLYQQAERDKTLDDKMRARLAEDMYARTPSGFKQVQEGLNVGKPDIDQQNSLKFRQEMANRDKFQNVGGSLVRITPKGEAKVEIPSRAPSPESNFQRRLDQDEYKTYFEQAQEAQIRLANPNMSPEGRARYEGMLKSSTDAMAKIRSKWQPSTSTATNAPAPLSAEVAKNAPQTPQYKEGQKLRNKKTGQMGEWRNGKIVPIE